MGREPEQIDMSPEEVGALRDRIRRKALTDDDLVTFGKLLTFCLWLQSKFSDCRLTISKLKKMIFGSRSEKRSRSKNIKPDSANDTDASSQEHATGKTTETSENNNASDDVEKNILPEGTPAEPENTGKDKRKGHGRMGIDAYVPDRIIDVPHQTLKPGDLCPLKCGGRLYNLGPCGVIRVTGQPIALVSQYDFQKLRCSPCGEVFTAESPPGFPPQKYDACFKSIMVCQKYFVATPFYRQEQWLKLQGIRLPDATQWELVDSAANSANPVFPVLEQLAANGTNINHDDTTVKITDIMRDNRLNPDKKRKGMFTTCVLSESDGHKICLYYSGTKHSGENVAAILEKRDPALPPVLRMCDALSSNLPKALAGILSNCLSHGRRKFVEVEELYPEECGYVIGQLAIVYVTDAEAKEKGMSREERLIHHQTHSKPAMEALKTWMAEQFALRKVEPASALGKAITYMQNHWPELTRFLSVAGAHIDNNVVERALKLVIRIRRTSLFHRSVHGAYIAGLFCSLIATCALAGKNPVHYLTALQGNRQAVRKNPEKWLPWNYESSLQGASSSDRDSGQSAA